MTDSARILTRVQLDSVLALLTSRAVKPVGRQNARATILDSHDAQAAEIERLREKVDELLVKLDAAERYNEDSDA